MSIPWKKADVIKAFADAMSGQTTTQGQPALPDLSGKIEKLAAQNKGVK
jgi:hypothetical protein